MANDGAVETAITATAVARGWKGRRVGSERKAAVEGMVDNRRLNNDLSVREIRPVTARREPTGFVAELQPRLEGTDECDPVAAPPVAYLGLVLAREGTRRWMMGFKCTAVI